ncbi:hypothetical protein JOF56_001030 [Kibdelosporangium banguiense]|uniref:PH domain-containing protein n=1 Tax=Kibdelosporangium banguiense TaxID=1365924 RepID=A0ABS4T975_9PSEU|nr:PH domain-containing protein [Kibdelosporangium banguiense]MBP2320645.1 hypothetical protein [Kibdelosporangium banguiense]
MLTLKWRRVAPRWGAMAVTGGLAVLAAVFALGVVTGVVKALAGGAEFEFGQLLAVLLILAGTAALVQLFRMDLYVSKEGVRQRGFLRTKTWSWSAIQEFRLKPKAAMKVLGGYSIWIRLADGTEAETSVHYSESLPTTRGVFLTDLQTQDILTQLQGALTRSRTAASKPT